MRPSDQLRYFAHELAAMAHTGLEFATNDYDRDRYERTERIAEGIAALVIDAEFTPERPYLAEVGIATPKMGCSIAAFDDAGRVALIRRADNGRWALPGGWAEVGSSPSENVLRELREETGYEAELVALVGVYDNRHFGSTSAYHIYTALFRGRIIGGDARPSIETPEVVLADPGEAPADMSLLQRTMLADALGAAGPAVYQ